MVIRKRLRSILIPLVAYSLAGAAAFYFVWQAIHGGRGLETKDAYQADMTRLDAEYASLEAERQQWEHRVAMMESDSVDRDLLEEEAHALLSRFDRRDLVIFLDRSAATANAQ